MSMERLRLCLSTGAPREASTEQQLRRLLLTHAVQDWIFTYDSPHPNGRRSPQPPRVDLNTRYLDDDDRLLATFVHEQLHWGIQKLEGGMIAELSHRYPNLPVSPPDGCGSTFSNYLHLVICAFEHLALTELLGQPRACATLQRADHYRRIHDIVLSDHDELIELARDHVELAPPSGQCAGGLHRALGLP